MVKVAADGIDVYEGGGPRIGHNDYCHLIIEDAKEVTNTFGQQQVNVEMVVYAPENLHGAKCTEFFDFTNKDGRSDGKIRRFTHFCARAGIITLEQANEMCKSGELDIDETSLVGRQICAKFEKPADKKYAKVSGWDFYSPLAKETDGWPKDPTLMAMLGVPPANGENAPTPQQSQSTAPQSQQSQAAPSAGQSPGKAGGGGGWKDSFK